MDTDENRFNDILNLPGWCTVEKMAELYNLVMKCGEEFGMKGEKLLSVELGVFGGRSLLPMALAHAHLGNGIAIGIDSWDNVTPLEGSNSPLNNDYWANIDIEGVFNTFKAAMSDERWAMSVDCIRGRSDAFAESFADNSITLLHQDSNHNKETILKELELWGPKLKPGGYWVCDDVNWVETKDAYAQVPKFGFEEVANYGTWAVYRKTTNSKFQIPNSKINLTGMMEWVTGFNEKSEALQSLAATRPYAIKPILLFLPDTMEWLERFARGIEHFIEEGVAPFCVPGIHATSFGIQGTHRYMRDTWARIVDKHGNTFTRQMPEELKNPFYLGDGKTGGYLSHYMLYNIMAAMPYEHFMVLEDDCRFGPLPSPEGEAGDDFNWREKLEQALMDVPEDFDFLFVGSSDAENKEPVHVKGDVWHFPHREGKPDYYPQTGYCYIVAKKALPVILATQRDTGDPVDVSLIYYAFPHLKVYAILPRLAHQEKTPLNR